MTLTYLSGGRIQGSSTTPITITDDMETNLGWVRTASDSPSGQGWTGTGDKVVFKSLGVASSPSNDENESPRISLDLQDSDFLNGVNPSDTSFTSKFELELTTYNASSGGENRTYIGFFSVNTWGGTSQDAFKLEIVGSGGGNKQWRVVVGDNEASETTHNNYKSTDFSVDAVIDTRYYITFTKDGDDHTVTITTNSDYVTGISTYGTKTVTRSNITSLRYFAVKGRGDTQEAEDGNTSGFIKNFYISSGTTDDKTTITNVPVGTRYEETDTRKMFRYSDDVAGTRVEVGNGSSNATWGYVAYFQVTGATANAVINKLAVHKYSGTANLKAAVWTDGADTSGTTNRPHNKLGGDATGSSTGDQWVTMTYSSSSDYPTIPSTGKFWIGVMSSADNTGYHSQTNSPSAYTNSVHASGVLDHSDFGSALPSPATYSGHGTIKPHYGYHIKGTGWVEKGTA